MIKRMPYEEEPWIRERLRNIHPNATAGGRAFIPRVDLLHLFLQGTKSPCKQTHTHGV